MSTDVKYTIDSESIKKIIDIKRNLFKKYKDLLEMKYLVCIVLI